MTTLASLAVAFQLLFQAGFSAAPLTEMDSSTYLGFPGRLYPDANTPPADHLAEGLRRATRIEPLDRPGRPDGTGKIVMISVGMSNTTQEFCAQQSLGPCEPWSFVGQAQADPAVNRSTLVIVNGAAGGQAASTWDSPSDPNYDRVRDQNLARANTTEAQVQIAWVKVANPRPNRSLPATNSDAYALVAQMGNIVRAMKTRYPNLLLVYFSSRIYAGYATTGLNPEPYAYESGFAVKWLIEAQIHQMRSGALDSRAGNLDYRSVAPWIGWGPYLWANGAAPRVDGLFWLPGDFQSDGTHPSRSGQEKVGRLLLQFFKNDPTSKGWFLDAPPVRRKRGARR